MLRFHGSAAKKEFVYVGYNSRLDAMQASFLRIFLRHLDRWNEERREAAARYTELLQGVVELPVDEPGHVYHQFCVRSPERDRISAALTEAQIGHAIYYSPPLHLQPALRYLGYAEGRLPRDRAGRPRESLPAALGGDHRRAAGRGRRRRAARRRARRELMRIPVNRHRVWQLVTDAVLIAAAWRITFFLRFDKTTPIYYRHLLDWQVLAVVVAINLMTFVLFGFYERWWRYVSTRDMWGAFRGVTIGSAITYLALYAFPPENTSRLPRSVAALDYLLLLALVAGSRLLARSLIERPQAGIVARGKEVLVVGAGDAGQMLIREMQRNRQLHYTPIGLIDDDPRKKNLRIHSVRVIGTTLELPHLLRDNRPDELLIAIPSARGDVRQRIVEACRAAGRAGQDAAGPP